MPNFKVVFHATKNKIAVLKIWVDFLLFAPFHRSSKALRENVSLSSLLFFSFVWMRFFISVLSFLKINYFTRSQIKGTFFCTWSFFENVSIDFIPTKWKLNFVFFSKHVFCFSIFFPILSVGCNYWSAIHDDYYFFDSFLFFVTSRFSIFDSNDRSFLVIWGSRPFVRSIVISLFGIFAMQSLNQISWNLLENNLAKFETQFVLVLLFSESF